MAKQQQITIEFLKNIGMQNQLPISFETVLCSRILKFRNLPHIHTLFFNLNILYHIKFKQKVIRNRYSLYNLLKQSNIKVKLFLC
jgi:hypothetical protein